MQSISPISSSNPLKIIRSLPLIEIPSNLISIRDDIPEDPIFESKYAAFVEGRTNVHHTRMSISCIRKGFWRSHALGFDLVEERVRRDDIEHVKGMIWFGNRPALFIYENPNKGDSFSYVCTDDIPVHAAYEELGISMVPVVLMGKPRNLQESAVTVKAIPIHGKGHIELIDGTTTVEQKTFKNLLHVSNISLSETLSILVAKIEKVKNRLKDFHKPANTTYHYHQSLYSVLVRTKEQVESIKLLADSGKLLVAASLLRPLHELALTFYIDWLMPTHMYRYLQFASVMSLDKWKDFCEKEKRQRISEGVSKSDANKIVASHTKAFALCSGVVEKARIFPFGENYHKRIYSLLSDIVHHDFSMTARYADTLDHGDDMVFNGNLAQTISRVAHATVSSILTRVQSDTGAVPVCSET